MSERASVYLTEKCDTFKKLVNFFLDKQAGFCKTLNEKRAVFLAQIDFWDWELDALVYSFQTFAERAKAWDDSASLTESLAKHGILVKNSILTDLDFKRYRRQISGRTVLKDGYYVPVRGEPDVTVAPVDKLNEVIRKWNKLLSICEDEIMPPEKTLRIAIGMKAAVVPNLEKFRKKELPE